MGARAEDEQKIAALLTKQVEDELNKLVTSTAAGLNIPAGFVWAEIVYIATQKARHLR